MNKLTAEWVEIAEGDYDSATILEQSGRSSVHRAICNHAQQCAEKYLKAYLQEHNQQFPKIHDLDELLSQCVVYDASLEILRGDLRSLNPYAVRIRYPGMAATPSIVQSAYSALLKIRTFIRAKLGL